MRLRQRQYLRLRCPSDSTRIGRLDRAWAQRVRLMRNSFRPPTGLADGFGREASPYHGPSAHGFTPDLPWVPGSQRVRLGGSTSDTAGGGRAGGHVDTSRLGAAREVPHGKFEDKRPGQGRLDRKSDMPEQ